MTHRIARTTLLLIAALLSSPTHRAEAKGIMDILEELSGPGPFTGKLPAIAVTVGCFSGRMLEFSLPESRVNTNPCVYVDFRALAVEAEGPFPEVTARLLEAGLSYEVWPFLEIGGGLGFARFATRDLAMTRNLPGLEDITTYNLTVTPVRYVFKPLVLIPSVRAKMGQNAGFFYVVTKPTVRFGRLTAANFGADNGWSTGTETLWSASAHLDIRQLLGYVLNR